MKKTDCQCFAIYANAGLDSDIDTAAQLGEGALGVIIGGHSHSFLYRPSSAGPIVFPKPNVTGAIEMGLHAPPRDCME